MSDDKDFGDLSFQAQMARLFTPAERHVSFRLPDRTTMTKTILPSRSCWLFRSGDFANKEPRTSNHHWPMSIRLIVRKWRRTWNTLCLVCCHLMMLRNWRKQGLDNALERVSQRQCDVRATPSMACCAYQDCLSQIHSMIVNYVAISVAKIGELHCTMWYACSQHNLWCCESRRLLTFGRLHGNVVTVH